MRYIYLTLIYSFIVISGYSQQTVTIQGQFKGTKEIKAFLKKDYGSFPSSNINDAGEFTFHIDVNSPTYYELAVGDISSDLYVEPGDHINISIEGAGSKLLFKGDRAKENEFIQLRDEKRNNIYGETLKKIRKYQQAAFSKSLDSVISLMRHDLIEFNRQNHLSPKFAELESINLDFIYLNQKSIYIGKYPSLHKNDPPLTTEFADILKNVNYNDLKFIPSPKFKDFVRNQTYNFTDDLLVTNPTLKDSTNENIVAQFMVIKALFTNDDVRDYAMYATLKYDLRNYGLNVPKTIITEFLNSCKQTDYKKDISDNYSIWTQLAKGLPAPDFSLADEKNIFYSLEKFKGKYMYIDVWATWCGPCLAEMPALKNLVAKFSNRHDEIAFIKISIDLDKVAWSNKLKNLTDGDIYNLHANDGVNSPFAKAYAVKDIPRYIIIDKAGKIVDANAPSPSSSLAAATIEKLIK